MFFNILQATNKIIEYEHKMFGFSLIKVEFNQYFVITTNFDRNKTQSKSLNVKTSENGKSVKSSQFCLNTGSHCELH